MRIVYCLDHVRNMGGGGIERVTVVKANALADVAGNEVYVIVAEDNEKLPLIHPISPQVHFVDLKVNYFDNTTSSRWRYYVRLWGKKKAHRKRLERALNEIKPDIVVSTSMCEKFIIPSYKGKWKTVRELHIVKTYRRLNADSLFARMSAAFGEAYDYGCQIWRYDSIVLLTNEDKEKHWKPDRRLTVIHNPVSFVTDESSALTNKKVIAMGRLCEEKNFDSLIRAFRAVADQHPDWTLEIYGDGEQRWMLQQLINELGLEHNVVLMGYTSDARSAMLKASCLVLSSRAEGFGLVLTEAMMCGLPVVSYACPCGPKDIITEGVDGFLVPVNDEGTLAARICQLIEDEPLRRRMGVAAKASAERYRVENIIPMWMDLFHRLLAGKQ